ncbi:MAG: phosphate ABC transporter permease subunit PstC [Chloroflexi bacterium]|nr:phosphate ABC transporter permease subunit PstC [Chloroflexota bacterium]MDE2702948.1 phosphate ABC transporter permease subunit PstC [Chloroflexota bacterium]MDE2936090.1 phosphate ABC transporter permease subunit PstC [Chloroflexota bacterium]MXX65786.1 phosphate ABC transporter permease subunit PstC [Chloroflexota bacterium]MXX99885.1 phosphate ABC transporter permease subunit PstC [Chloroflexota bacterium]
MQQQQTVDLSPKRKRILVEGAVRSVLFAAAAVSVLTTAGIIFTLLGETFQFFTQVSPVEFLTGTRWTPLFVSKHFGVLPLVNGTLAVALVAMLIAVPLGLLAAIFMSEVAAPQLRTVLKPALEVLAGIPTVVYGYFALLFVTPILREIFPDAGIFNVLSAGIVMGFMILPMMASITEDALQAVPVGLREGSYALGATKLETAVKVIVPAALSGILAAVILSISRAIGETMIVSIAAGQQPRLGFDLLNSMETMTAYIVQVSLGDTPQGTIEYQTIFAVGTLLFAMTFVMNLLGDWLVRRFREVYE